MSNKKLWKNWLFLLLLMMPFAPNGQSLVGNGSGNSLPTLYAYQENKASPSSQVEDNFIFPKRRRYVYITVELLAAILLVALSSIFLWQRSFRRIKQQEKATARLLKEKEKLLEKLTKTQDQLIQSEKMASLGQLTAGIAHEINNPINFISTSVQGLKLDFEDLRKLLHQLYQMNGQNFNEDSLQEILQLKEKIDAEFLEKEMVHLMNIIEQGVHRTHTIINHLRTFSQNTSTEFLESDIHEGLNAVLVILNSKIEGRIQIHRNYGQIPKIKCQISRLNQVFFNILDNAINAIQDKGEIYITTSQSDQWISIKIRDTGIGMDDATKNRIFEPFYTTQEVGAGMGLGLSTSFGIIEQHGGVIQVESNPDEHSKRKGTEIIITLPIEAKDSN